jgi:nicotinamidase/pyrazinamidase
VNALLLVDVQNDFTPATDKKPAGALAVPLGNEVIAVANRLMPHYELIVATQDWHPAGHKSFASEHPDHQVGEVIEWEGLAQLLWPDHCVQETLGAELCADLQRERISAVVQKGTDLNIDSYSGFFDNGHRKATGLADVLRDHGVTSLDIMGLATDYCVKFTVLDALQIGFEVRVLLEGCRGVELQPGDCARAVAEMRDAGAEMVSGS